MGFGAELLFIILLGFVVLGPNGLQNVIGHVLRAKSEIDKVTRGLKSQLTSELDQKVKPK